jgi:hypothetical protein
MLQSPSQLLQNKLEPTSREGEVEHYLRAARFRSVLSRSEGAGGQSRRLSPLFPIRKLFFAFLARKIDVKSQNHLTHSTQTTSTWHFSSLQSHILKTVEKNKISPGSPPGLIS